MKRTLFAIACLIGITLNTGVSAQAVTVPTATGFNVLTGTTTAVVTWDSFPTGTISSISLSASLGKVKKIKTLTAAATTATFTGLTANSPYVFSITALNGKTASQIISISMSTLRTKLANSIFFIQPSNMTIGQEDQFLMGMPNGGVTSFRTTTSSKCSIVNSVYVRAIAAGTCTIIASNPGDIQYLAAPSVTKSLTVTAPIPAGAKTLLWSDEFNSTGAPNTTNWTPDLGDGCNAGPGCGWGNNESQAYAACAFTQTGGIMTIAATTPTGNPNCRTNKNWTSGKITTKGKRNFTYGYFEARMKMPAGGGAWPAFWLLGSNIDTVSWPASGELDIMEYTGNAPYRSTSAVHYANSSGNHDYKSNGLENAALLSADYHTYSMLWLPTEVTFSIDGKQILKTTKADTGLTRWPFGPNAQNVDPKMYLIFNLAMGGNYGGAIQSGLNRAEFSIDYVRYYSVSGVGKLN